MALGWMWGWWTPASEVSARAGQGRAWRHVSFGLLVMMAVSGLQAAPSRMIWRMPAAPLPIGVTGLHEQRSRFEVAPGVVQHRVIRGHASLQDHFEVEVGLGMTEAEVVRLEVALRQAGYASKRSVAPRSHFLPDNTGVWVRVAAPYSSASQADEVVKALKALGFERAKRRYTAEDGVATTGPWVLNVVAVHPGFAGAVRSTLATGVIPVKALTSEMSRETGALMALNASYFVVNPSMGTPGDLAGLGVIDGRLVSEGVEGRPALFLRQDGRQRRAHIEHGIETMLTLRLPSGASRRLDGLNRQPGLNANCGNPFDAETSVALHDVVCTDPHEIVAFSADFGARADAGQGVEVRVDASGLVTEVIDARGGEIPARGWLLQGIGDGAAWLRTNVRVGQRLALSMSLRNDAGQRLALRAGSYAVNGGPTLLRDGRPASPAQIVREGYGLRSVTTVPEGAAHADRAYFTNEWFVRRHPHAIVGITANGTLLFVTVDGRAPRYSAGLSVIECMDLMRHLGAIQAMKLDGGGSTMMVVNGRPQNVPSDLAGERPVGDAIVILP